MINRTLQPHSLGEEERRNPRVHLFNGRKAGFTLIEILVTISIISLLLGIGAFAMSKLSSEGRRTQTQSMLNGLKGALTEYQTKTESVLAHENTANTNLTSSEQVVFQFQKVPTAYDQLLAAVNSSTQQSNKRIFDDKDGNDNVNEIYDYWGTQILYRSSNLTWDTGNDTVSSGDLSDDKYKTKFPAFFSAGPDKEFGTDDDVNTLEME